MAYELLRVAILRAMLADARKTSAENYCHGAWYAGDEEHTAFLAGWDAAMEYVNNKLAEGIGHLDS